MDTAILGFIGLVILFGAPLAVLLVLGARVGRKRIHSKNRDWMKLLKLDAKELITAINKVRPK